MVLWSNLPCITSGGRGFKSRCRLSSIFAGSHQFAGARQFFHDEMESDEIVSEEMESKRRRKVETQFEYLTSSSAICFQIIEIANSVKYSCV